MTHPDLHHFNAAQGWFELGDLAEAVREIDLIGRKNQSHPDVLDLRWHLCARAGRWMDAAGVGEQLVILAPDRCDGWIHRSYSLHELKRTQEAWDKLLPAVERFPDVTTVPYNLACYACQMGRLDDGRKWLARAMETGERERVLAMALGDRDLRSLWAELKADHGPPSC